MRKFEVGDRVKLVVPEGKVFRDFRTGLTEPMVQLLKENDNILTVKHFDNSYSTFEVEEDETWAWTWDADFFEKVEETERKTANTNKKVYLASPFFNDEELLDMAKVCGCLRNKGLDVFAPYENQNKQLEFCSKEWRNATFKSDIDHIDNADIVVAVVNGNYCDSGTAWEIGYAYATKKPIIVVNLRKEIVNLMISDSLHAYIDSLENLESYDFAELPAMPYINYVW